MKVRKTASRKQARREVGQWVTDRTIISDRTARRIAGEIYHDVDEARSLRGVYDRTPSNVEGLARGQDIPRAKIVEECGILLGAIRDPSMISTVEALKAWAEWHFDQFHKSLFPPMG